MSQPYQYLPGSTYMVQRRCVQRQFLLLPDDTVNQLFLYCLSYAAQKTGVVPHGFCVLSNHYHIVLSDPKASLPEFMKRLNELLARAINCYRGRRESVFVQETNVPLRLYDPDSVRATLVYTLTNPVAAGLVEQGSQWPGLRSAPEEIGGEPLVVERPDFFFRETMPERLTLCLEMAPGFEDTEPGNFRRELAAEIRAKEKEHREAFRRQNRRFMGVEAVLARSPTECPETPYESLGSRSPRIACRDPQKRAEAIEAHAEFLAAYETALRRFRRGEREVVFPAGTYLMRVRFQVACEDSAAPT